MARDGYIITPVYYDPDHDSHQLKLEWTAAQDIVTNKSTITWTLKYITSYAYYTVVSKTKVIIDGRTVFDRPGQANQYGGTVATGTIELQHNSVGERSFSASIQAGIYEHSVNRTASGTWTLDTIPRGSTVTASGALSFGSQGTLNIARASTGFYDTITYSLGSYSGTIATLANNNALSQDINWTPDPNMMNAVPNATSASVVITCSTYSDSAGTTLIATKTTNVSISVPSSVIPTVAFSSMVNTNNTFGAYTQNLSKIQVVLAGAGAYSSTIVSYQVLFEDVTYTGQSIETDVIKGSGNNIPVQARVIDSRGREGVLTTTIDVLAYTQPTIDFSVHRSTVNGTADDMGSYAHIWFEGQVSATGNNAVTPTLKMRQVGASSWTNVTIESGDATYTGTTKVEVEKTVNADDTKSWEFMATITDSAGASASMNITISVGYSTIDFKAGGRGISFGTTALNDDFVCDMDAFFGGKIMHKNLLRNTMIYGDDHGVEFRDNGDFGVKANGTASSSANAWLEYGKFVGVPGKKYIMTGCPSTGATNKHYIYISADGAGDLGTIRETGGGVTFTYPSNASESGLSVRIAIYKGTQADNLVFYPMIRDAALADDSFEPYMLNVPELTGGGVFAVRAGTKMYQQGSTPTGSDIVIFTYSELDAIFGMSGTTYYNCIVFAVNGHYDAYATKITSVYNKSDGIHAIFDPAMSTTSAFRLNYIAMRF